MEYVELHFIFYFLNKNTTIQQTKNQPAGVNGSWIQYFSDFRLIGKSNRPQFLLFAYRYVSAAYHKGPIYCYIPIKSHRDNVVLRARETA